MRLDAPSEAPWIPHLGPADRRCICRMRRAIPGSPTLEPRAAGSSPCDVLRRAALGSELGAGVAGDTTLDQSLGIERRAVALGLVHAVGGDRELSVVEPLDPALFAQVPEVEREGAERNVHETPGPEL